jgi:hypothetical protein
MHVLLSTTRRFLLTATEFELPSTLSLTHSGIAAEDLFNLLIKEKLGAFAPLHNSYDTRFLLTYVKFIS